MILCPPKQFIVMGSIFIIIIIICVLLRKLKREKLFTIYKILAIFLPIFEIVKISYSTYFDIINGETFNYGGIIPLYTCYMVFYFLPFVAWGIGKMQRYSIITLVDMGVIEIVSKVNEKVKLKKGLVGVH